MQHGIAVSISGEPRQIDRAGSVVSPRTGGDCLVARVFLPVATGYRRGRTAIDAWALALTFGVAVLIGIAGNIGISMWNRWFR